MESWNLLYLTPSDGCVLQKRLAWPFFFFVINPRVFSANRVDLGFFCFINPILLVFVCVFVIWFLSSFSVARVCFCLSFFVLYSLFGVSDFQFVISTFTPLFFIEISFVLPPPPRQAQRRRGFEPWWSWGSGKCREHCQLPTQCASAWFFLFLGYFVLEGGRKGSVLLLFGVYLY